MADDTILRCRPSTASPQDRSGFWGSAILIRPRLYVGDTQIRGEETVRGNVFRDLGRGNADVEQLKALLAAEIIKTAEIAMSWIAMN